MTHFLEEIEHSMDFSEQVVKILSVKEEQPVLTDHILYEEVLLENSQTKVLASIPLPPPMQALITLHHKIWVEIEMRKEIRLLTEKEAIGFQVKLDVLMRVYYKWMAEAIRTNSELQKLIQGKYFIAHIGNNWELLFIERKHTQE